MKNFQFTLILSRVDSLEEGVHSAITQVEGSDLGVRVVRVESATANTIAKINANLLDIGSS